MLDENGGHLGSLKPYESATPLYKENGMTHVVYETDKGMNTKSGYVRYEGSAPTITTIPTPSTSGAQKIVYGSSGKGRQLAAYKLGNGRNSLVLVCAVHGWEDNWPADGIELVKIGNSVVENFANNVPSKFSLYVIPVANPDGLSEGYTNNGPGRCTIVGGVDINRDFPLGFTPHGTSRYWTGDAPLSVPESRNLRDFIQGVKNNTSGEMIVIDLHGWEGAAIGNAEVGQYFRNQFGFEQRSGYGEDRGFLIAWAKSIGAKSALIELPTNTYSHSDVVNGGYAQKVINSVKEILSATSGVSTNKHELIVVSGCEMGDRVWKDRYKYNFIVPAIKQLKEFKAQYPKDKIAWIIYSYGYNIYGYSGKDVLDFQDTASKLNVNLVFVEDTEKLINYINSNRTYCKISNFVVFSHGVVHAVEMAFRYPEMGGPISKCTFGISEIFKIDTDSFEKDAFSQFYTCNGATEKDGTSFAKEWSKHGLGKVKAAVNRTDYSIILGKTSSEIDNYLKEADKIHKGYCDDTIGYYPGSGKDAY